jgi:hypothetical protein
MTEGGSDTKAPSCLAAGQVSRTTYYSKASGNTPQGSDCNMDEDPVVGLKDLVDDLRGRLGEHPPGDAAPVTACTVLWLHGPGTMAVTITEQRL